jgi:excisionase family DNA binding protein
VPTAYDINPCGHDANCPTYQTTPVSATLTPLQHACYSLYNHAVANLIHVEDAAEQFGIHRTTLYRYIRIGKLTGYRRGLGNGTFLDRRELDQLATYEPVKPTAKP